MKIILHEGVPVCEVMLSGERTFLWKPIGPEAWVELYALYPEPEEPREKTVNDLGTEIEVHIAPDDPRYQAYAEERDRHWAAFSRRVQEVERLDSAEFIDVPDGWQVPYAFRRAGIETATDPDELKLQFLRYTVIKTEEDGRLVTQAIRGGAEITAEEEAAAVPSSGPRG